MKEVYFLLPDVTEWVQKNPKNSQRLPALEWLFSRGKVGGEKMNFEQRMAQLTAVDVCHMSWSGFLYFHETGKKVSDRIIYRAYPLFITLDMNDAVAVTGPELAISAAEAALLLADMNELIKPEGYVLECSTNGHWFLLAEESFEVEPATASTINGQKLAQFIPQGEAGSRYRQLINLLQMGLHDHLVNQQREHNDQPVINGFWFANVGHLPVDSDTFLAWKIESNDPAVMGMNEFFSETASAPILHATRFSTSECLHEFDATIVAKAIEDLKTGTLNKITLDLCTSAPKVATKSSLKAFWKWPKCLPHYS